ncbi:MAG: acetoacetate decarboxylase family protein [Segniliparus sp.]|uniref:acetoacetate decarboxylase family protein n=1 Tax=Segniliparus sp. TaxID=2804064 RepID=UPI003F3012E8
MGVAVSKGAAEGALTGFPPAPWHLGASGLVSVFLVDEDRLPGSFAELRPAGWRPFRVGGRVVVTVSSISYSEGGVLAYDEIVVATPVRRGASVGASVPQIWVDSEASRNGARALWGIPKELAQFHRTTTAKSVGAGMDLDGTAAVRLSAKIGLPLTPRRLKLPDFSLIQRFAGSEFVSRHFVVTGVRLARVSWAFGEGGPLGYLRGLKPLVSVAMPDVALVFGFETAARPV